jgi:hypothetical protein
VPNKVIRKVYLILFPSAGSYAKEFAATFQDEEIPSTTPTFSFHLTVESAVTRFYINSPGIKALKSLLWVINHRFSNLYYSPALPAMASVILTFTTESRAFEILEALIQISIEKKQTLEQFITVDANQFRQLVALIVNTLYSQIDGLESLVQVRKINLPASIAEMLKVFFIDYFKLPFLLRSLNWVLSEGIFKCISGHIAELSSFESEFQAFCYTFDDDEEIFFHAMKTKINVRRKTELELPILKNLSCFKYSRPKCESFPTLITACELEFIWAGIPEIFKHYTLNSWFSTTNDGFSLRALLRKGAEQTKTSASLVLVKSQSHQIIGVFFDSGFVSGDKYTGTANSFLVSLRPNPAIYFSTGVNDMYAFISESIIIFGGGSSGPALTIDRELLHCSSNSCLTFNNPPLLSGDLISLEVLSLSLTN